MSDKPQRTSQFASIVNEMNRGRLAAIVDEKLMEVAERVENVGGTGTITVKLSISRTQSGEQEIIAKVSHTTPTAKMPPSLWFWDADRQTYMRDDPKQKTLTLESVESGSPV